MMIHLHPWKCAVLRWSPEALKDIWIFNVTKRLFTNQPLKEKPRHKKKKKTRKIQVMWFPVRLEVTETENWLFHSTFSTLTLKSLQTSYWIYEDHKLWKGFDRTNVTDRTKAAWIWRHGMTPCTKVSSCCAKWTKAKLKEC